MPSVLRIDTLIQRYTNAEPNHKRLFINDPYWFSFWTIYNAIILGSGLHIGLFLEITPVNYTILGYVGLFAMVACFFISKMLIPGGYSSLKQAICHMGRMRTKKGEKNLKGAFFIGLFFSLNALIVVILGMLLLEHAHEDISFRISAYLCISSAIFSILTGIVPIDLYEKWHLFCAFAYFIICNFWLLNLLIFLMLLGYASIYMKVMFVLVAFNGICYIIGYSKNYRYTATFQKLWLLFTGLSFVLLMQYFSSPTYVF